MNILQAEIRNAHSGQIWTLAFHPMGHLLATGGYDGQTRFWCRSRPGDAWLDRAPRDLNNDVVAEGGTLTLLESVHHVAAFRRMAQLSHTQSGSDQWSCVCP